VFLYIIKEYAPVIKLNKAKNSIKNIENAVVAVINIISLSKLIDGGAAILILENKNHHRDIEGRNIIIPFIKNMLRVCKIS